MAFGFVRARVGAAAAVCAVAFVAAGCSSNNTTTSPTPVTSSTETFSGFLTAGTRLSRSVTLSTQTTLTATLDRTTPPDVVVGIGLGLLDGSDCALSNSTTGTGGSGVALATHVDAGTYCVQIFDVGQVPSDPLAFTITIDHP
jgi:hypothetical protein